MTKDEVLSILRSSEGEFISGEELAKELNLSRMSINKAVRSLQEEGFKIEAVSKKGYRLLSFDVYNQRSLTEALPDLKVFYYDEYEGSSNNEAKKLAGSVDGPFAVVVNTQTGGKGRLGRHFSSPEGGVYFSLVLPSDMCGEIDLITTRAALAVSMAIDKVCGVETEIKWVNDIYLGNRKCVGILTEGIVNLELGGLDKVIIGVGINLNSTLSDFPEELHDILTTVKDETGKEYSKLEMLKVAIEEIIGIQKKSFIEEYRKRSFVLGNPVWVIRNGERVAADAIDVDEKAHLVVRYLDGRVEHLSSAEVSLRLRNN